MASFAYLVEPKTRLTEVVSAIESKFPIEREPPRVLRKTILDSFDWRLFARSANLSAIREDGKLSLSLESPKRLLTCRLPNGELPAFESDLPDGRVRDAVASAIDVRRLLAQLELELKVQSVRLLNDDQKTVAWLHVQRGTAASPEKGGRRKPLPLVVLLTPIRGYERSLRVAADIIERDVGLKPIGDTPLATAMRVVGIEPGDYVAKKPFTLEPGMRADKAITTICRGMLETIRANEDGLRRHLDPEFLHDFRVAVRRTRSVLSLFKGVLPAEARTHFKGEFKWLGRITGPVRDLDVYLQKIPGYRADLPKSMRQDLDPLDKYLHEHHRGERRRLVSRMKSNRYQELLESWGEFLAREGNDDAACPDAARPIADVASERIWKVYRRVYKHGRNIMPDTPAEALHELRIDCKMLRYLLEFFRSLYPAKEMTKLVNALRQLQDNLGDFNDLQVQQTSLSRFAQEMSDEGVATVESLVAIGRLVEHLAQRQVTERERFTECWNDFATPAIRRRFRRLFKDAAPGAR